MERAEKAPASRNDILAKRFGIPMEGYTYFFPYEETIPHPKRYFNKMACIMGADFSQGDDFCSFTFLFPLRNGKFGIKTRSYISSLTFTKLPQAMRYKYQIFIDEGSLCVLNGAIISMDEVYEDINNYIIDHDFDVVGFGYDPYNASKFVSEWVRENSEFGVKVVPQGAKTESVPLGELKKLSEERMLLFDEDIMQFALGNCIVLEDTNGNRKLYKAKREHKIDPVAALLDAFVAYKDLSDLFI